MCIFEIRSFKLHVFFSCSHIFCHLPYLLRDCGCNDIHIRTYMQVSTADNICECVMSSEQQSCIQSVLTFSFICWFGNVSQKDKNKLQRVVNISSKITGLKQTSVTALYEKQVLRKANKIINDSTHILYNEYVLLPSSRRFRTITSKTNIKRDSFIPMSVRLLNSKR